MTHSQFKHTAAPWEHYDDTGPKGKTGRHEIIAFGRTVARIYSTKGLEGEDEANACLIAAAPEMLEALDAVLDRYEIESVLAAPTLSKVRAAVAKARRRV